MLSLIELDITEDLKKRLDRIGSNTGESDDHIMPYSEASKDLHDKKEWNQEASATKLVEQERIEAKTNFHRRKLGSSSKLYIIKGQFASESSTNSWQDLSLFSATKTDQGSLDQEGHDPSREPLKSSNVEKRAKVLNHLHFLCRFQTFSTGFRVLTCSCLYSVIDDVYFGT
ncbi:hypothetical protein VNO77_22056 [Canavalia gladiata]|uniref:Uncharacterized protein n=1 Tax=Canavalia gladiata TaxID=3824 RepID=A0AAN9QAF7_CANGL